MSIEFRYRQEKSFGGQIIHCPVAKVTFIGSNSRKVIEYMYIDSGADFTMIPYKLGLYLGLDSSHYKVEEVRGISGVIGVIFVSLDIKIGSYQFSAKVA